MNIRGLSYLASLFLFLAIFPWEYGYYQLLRWGIFIIAIVVANGFFKSSLNHWAVIFGVIALLFNPIMPIFLSRTTWIPIDLVAAILFLIAGKSVKV